MTLLGDGKNEALVADGKCKLFYPVAGAGVE